MSASTGSTTKFNVVDSRSIWVRRVIGVTAAACLGALAVYTTTGFAIAPINPMLASTIAPGHSGTLSSLTRFRFQTARSREQLPQIVRLARATLQAAPLDHAAARTVAALDVIGQREARAERLFTLVGANTLRDAMTHAWLLNSAYRQRDFDRVVRQADIVLRLDAKLRPAAFAALNQLVADGQVIPALASLLRTNPEWREAFLVAMGQEKEARENQLRLLRILRSGPTPPSAEELRTFFIVDSSRVRIDQLARTYTELRPASMGGSARFIRDGNFDDNGNYGPFGWIYYVGDAGFAESSASPAGVGKSMYVELDGRSDAVVATQFLTLAPGAYTLTLRSYGLSELRGQTRLNLSCQSTPSSRRLHVSMPIRGMVNDWQSQRWQFSVPQECAGPILDIAWRPEAVSRSEQLYIDDVVIRPAAAEQTPATSAGSANGQDRSAGQPVRPD